MNELTVFLSQQEEIDIETQLKKLFSFQDKFAKKEQIALFLDEIRESGYPFKAIIQGIDSLKNGKLARITLADIMQAISEKIEPSNVEQKESVKCDICLGLGIVEMRDENGYKFVLACQCSNGDEHERRGRFRWNGTEIQGFKNGTLYSSSIYNIKKKFKDIYLD